MEIFKERAFFISIALFIFLFGINEADAQATLDTVSIVNSMIRDKRLDEASHLLERYRHEHPKDFNLLWLYAQTEYWLKKNVHSQQLYEQAIKLQPANAYLQLDYARMLLNIEKYQKSQTLLLKLRDYDVTREAAKFELAKSYYWQKNNLKAREEVEELLKINPKNNDAKKLLNDILISSSFWINASAGYTSDTQPLQSISPAFEGGTSLHKFFSPYAAVYTPVFNYNGQVVSSSWVLIGNRFSFGKGPELRVDVGSVQFPYQGRKELTRHVRLRQKISNPVTFDVQAEHKPYFNTLRSIDTIITVNHFSSSLDLNSKNGVLGKIAFDDNHFADGNDVYSWYGYLLSKPIKISGTQLRLGYSYAFNDSRKNKFVPQGSVSQIITTGNLSGIYDPYFTPEQQQIHGALLSWLAPFKYFKLGVNTNVSFYATTLNPYFYLQRKNPNTYTLTKDYATIRYSPMEVNTYIEWQPSVKWSVRADYQYRKTFFFHSQYISLSIRTILFHERK